MIKHTVSVVMSSVALLWTTAGLPGETLWVDAQSRAEQPDGSADSPFPEIAHALQQAQPGDTVTVRQGVYRQRLRVPSGKPGKPITLRAAPGERVVVSGCIPLEGWREVGDGVWVTTLDWKPQRLFLDGKLQRIARRPAEGWWRSAEATDSGLIDPANLRNIEAAAAGGEVRVWLQRGNTFATFPLKSLDRATGRLALTLDPVKDKGRLSDGDKYYLQHRAEFIRAAGQWAVEPDGEKFNVFYKPADAADPGRIEAPFFEGSLITVRDANHVRIEGLQVAGSRHMGIEIHAATDVAVRNCVVYHNAYTGISMREAVQSVVARNIVRQNEYGISVSFSRGVTVEENDVGYNGTDGLLVTWKSDDVSVRRNYSHHHLLWGHPDNLQLYRGVTNVRFEDNLLLAGGQSVMAEETTDGEFRGNMIVGCGAYMLIMGHHNAGRYEIHGNTLAMAGYGLMSLTWEDYDLRENVLMGGHGGALFGVKGIRGYRADRNVFWNSARAVNPMIIATDAGWHRDFPAVQEATGQDEHSVYADPKFHNAPVAFAVLDSRRLHESTRDRWYLRGGAGAFRPGDYIEVNFDGLRRRVTEVEEASITVTPGLDERPVKGWLVANWAANTNFQLDLRLSADSPGAKLSATGGPVGSTLDIAAYQRGDFNGDGTRDIPPLPKELSD